MTSNNGPVYKKSFQFTLRIIEQYEILVKQREFAISKQRLKSGTSIGANVNEASVGFSRNDISYKMSVSSKKPENQCIGLACLKKVSWLM